MDRREILGRGKIKFLDLREKLDKVNFEFLRQDEGGYFEAVVMKRDLGKLTACLEEFMGDAILPSQLPKQMDKVLKEAGGVNSGQMLYCKEDGSETVMALLWPWMDGIHTTVKIIKQK